MNILKARNELRDYLYYLNKYSDLRSEYSDKILNKIDKILGEVE